MSLVLTHISVSERPKLFEAIRSLLVQNGALVIYQIVHLEKTKPSPIWVMHLIPSHVDYPYLAEYVRSVKTYFTTVATYLKGNVLIARN